MRLAKRPALILGAIVLAAAVAPLSGASAAENDSAGPPPGQGDSIFITKNRHFDPAHGVTQGSGTASDPYVFSGMSLNDLYIKDTNRYVRITGNTITGRLTLDWIGDRIDVRNNKIGDLRVNQNVRRKGDMTSGLIADNEIGVVGQLRHFDGLFTRNTVGSPEGNMWDSIPFFQQRAVNFDGFNGGRFTNNVVYGYMDATLHGHHHSSSFEDSDESHYHGADAEHAMHEDMDHSVRYHRVYITDNTIYSDIGYALRYNDVVHSANDRTAASETNKELNKPHIHHTRVYMTGNELIGSGLMVDIFNANDERHLDTATGSVVIADNDITLARSDDQIFQGTPAGIAVYSAKDVMMTIEGNKISGFVSESTTPIVGEWTEPSSTGILLSEIGQAHIFIADNILAHHGTGVWAQRMTKTVYWHISGLKTQDVQTEVYYDKNDVANSPEESP